MRSDLNIVRGIGGAEVFRQFFYAENEALASVMFLDDQLSIEMVDRATCRPEIWSVVKQEGIELWDMISSPHYSLYNPIIAI